MTVSPTAQIAKRPAGAEEPLHSARVVPVAWPWRGVTAYSCNPCGSSSGRGEESRLTAAIPVDHRLAVVRSHGLQLQSLWIIPTVADIVTATKRPSVRSNAIITRALANTCQT